LKDCGVGICNTDIPPIPHAFPLKAYATTDKGYIRYSGKNLDNWYPKGPALSAKQKTAQRNARYDYDYSADELARHAAAQRLLLTKTSGIAVAYNNHYQAKAIRNAMENLRLLTETP
jgi:uncharacterized protein YecE (DUF72 family)